MKLWDKKKYLVNDKILNFTIGKDRELDLYIAKYDLLASKAHAKMLLKVGLIKKDEEKKLQLGLNELLFQIKSGVFHIDKEFEDVHSKIEFYLINKFGDAGKKIHIARSRNDQILVAIQLFFKDYINNINEKINYLIDIFLKQAQKNKLNIYPGYTHFQAAMPSSFGMWFAAYAEILILDLYDFDTASKIANQNPLGSGAGFGTSFPIDRLFTTKELGFDNVLVSSVSAQILRGKTEKSLANALATISSTLSKFCYDIIMYNSQDLNFINIPKEITTGSSIMPHKNNPDVFELIRAYCNQFQSIPNNITLIINNLPSGYHRDFQILKEILFQPMMKFIDILDVLIFIVPKISINKNIINQSKYDSIYSVENINEKIKNNFLFRDAYKDIANELETKTYKPNKNFKTHHLGSIHFLGIEEIQKKRLKK